MISGNTVEEARLLQRVSATAIANQAILKCILSEIAVTVDNVTFFVGDFLDPTDDEHDDLVMEIATAIEEVVQTANTLKRAQLKRHDGNA